MKKLLAVLLLTMPSLAFSFDQIHCRKVDDLRIIIKVDRSVLMLAEDEYESNEYIIKARKITSESKSAISAYGLLLNLTNEPTSLDKSNIDGNASHLFKAVLSKGMAAHYKGEYVCLRNGYLALTIQGDEVDGGYSISLNY